MTVLERIWVAAVVVVGIVFSIPTLRSWLRLKVSRLALERMTMTPDSKPDRCPAASCNGRLIVDAYRVADDLHHDVSLFISPKGPETGQRVICTLGHGPWEIRCDNGQISYFAIA